MSESDEAERKEGGNGADPVEGNEAPTEPTVEGESATEVDQVALAKAEGQRFRDQLLRTAADFDNFRKRARREQEDAVRKGKESALKELLPVFDNLERALTSAEKAPDVKAVVEGLKLVMRQFTQSTEKMGIKRVPTVGHPFDPTLHEAIQHVESTEHAAGVVALEVQAGYQLGDALLRAALVAVSKGPPAAAPAEGGADEPPAS